MLIIQSSFKHAAVWCIIFNMESQYLSMCQLKRIFADCPGYSLVTYLLTHQVIFWRKIQSVGHSEYPQQMIC